MDPIVGAVAAHKVAVGATVIGSVLGIVAWKAYKQFAPIEIVIKGATITAVSLSAGATTLTVLDAHKIHNRPVNDLAYEIRSDIEVQRGDGSQVDFAKVVMAAAKARKLAKEYIDSLSSTTAV